jgi:hypothetical protein
MIHDTMPNDDALSMAMFLAGALMVFTPLITASVVVYVLWRKRGRTAHATTMDATAAAGSGD